MELRFSYDTNFINFLPPKAQILCATHHYPIYPGHYIPNIPDISVHHNLFQFIWFHSVTCGAVQHFKLRMRWLSVTVSCLHSILFEKNVQYSLTIKPASIDFLMRFCCNTFTFIYCLLDEVFKIPLDFQVVNVWFAIQTASCNSYIPSWPCPLAVDSNIYHNIIY